MSVFSAKFGIARFGKSFFGERNPQTWIKESDIDIDREIEKSIDIDKEIGISADIDREIDLSIGETN